MNESFAFHGYSLNNQAVVQVQGEDIYQIDYMGNAQQVVGKTLDAYKELEQTTKEYYDKLVELGVIEKPKEPQEVMAEMQATMAGMADLIKSLSDEVKELKQNGPERNPVSSEQNVSEREPSRRSGKSQGSNSGNS